MDKYTIFEIINTIGYYAILIFCIANAIESFKRTENVIFIFIILIFGVLTFIHSTLLWDYVLNEYIKKN